MKCKKIELLLLACFSNVQLEMAVLSYPEDHHDAHVRGAAFANVIIRDNERVLERVLDLNPGNGHDIFVELKYLETVLIFSRKWLIIFVLI